MWSCVNPWFQRLRIWGANGQEDRIQAVGVIDKDYNEFGVFWFLTCWGERDIIELINKESIKFHNKLNKVILLVDVRPPRPHPTSSPWLHLEPPIKRHP